MSFANPKLAAFAGIVQAPAASVATAKRVSFTATLLVVEACRHRTQNHWKGSAFLPGTVQALFDVTFPRHTIAEPCLPPFALLDRFEIMTHILVLAGAYVLALPIGWNREKHERSAGLRTFPLVALAACGFVQATEPLTRTSPEATARIVEGVITGVGFIGGGAILKFGGSVRGTATAASLWATGAIGVAVGLGSYDVAITISLFTMATLQFLSPLKDEPEETDEIEPRAAPSSPQKE